MEKVLLGKTGLLVSRVGMGGIPIQRDNANNAYEVIKEAYIKGINLFDSAKAYTVSEEYIGQAILKLEKEFVNFRESIVITSKSMAKTYEGMKKDIIDSIEKMHCQYIDVYQLHNVQPGNDYSEAIRAIEDAIKEGLVKHIGVTSHNLNYLNEMIDTGTFETIQYPFNIVEEQGRDILKKAYNLGIGILGMKPLAGGAIDDGAIAIKYILNQDFVAIPIPGMGSVKEVDEITSVVKGNYTVLEEAKIKEYKNTLTGNFCRRCGYCKPCTKGIDIPFVFLCEGYYRRYNLKEWAIERYNTIKVKASNCVNCGICEQRCPYHLPIRKKLKEAIEVLENE